MKFNFSPVQELSPVEKSTLQDFFEKIKNACVRSPNCETCLIKDICDKENVPDFIETILDRLGIL